MVGSLRLTASFFPSFIPSFVSSIFSLNQRFNEVMSKIDQFKFQLAGLSTKVEEIAFIEQMVRERQEALNFEMQKIDQVIAELSKISLDMQPKIQEEIFYLKNGYEERLNPQFHQFVRKETKFLFEHISSIFFEMKLYLEQERNLSESIREVLINNGNDIEIQDVDKDIDINRDTLDKMEDELARLLACERLTLNKWVQLLIECDIRIENAEKVCNENLEIISDFINTLNEYGMVLPN